MIAPKAKSPAPDASNDTTSRSPSSLRVSDQVAMPSLSHRRRLVERVIGGVMEDDVGDLVDHRLLEVVG